MIKKGASKQNIVIIVLCILLILSIGFGVSYSYFSGESKSNVSGTLTTATLAVELDPIHPTLGKTTDFILHEKDKTVIPGEPLSNIALQITNNASFNTYMMVLFSLDILDGSEEAIDESRKLTAMDIQREVVGSGWRQYVYTCKDTETKLSVLVYMGNKDFSGNITTGGSGTGVFPGSAEDRTSQVFEHNSLRLPYNWGNMMQNTTIKLTFTAYVMQSDNLQELPTYSTLTSPTTSATLRAEAIAKTMIGVFELDKTPAPVEPPVVEP